MYQANPFAKCRRKCIEYVDRWVEPSPQSLVSAARLLELVDLDLKYGQDGTGRVACLELAGERMSDNILLGLSVICLEGFFKNDFEIGRGCCRCGIHRHRARSGKLTHVEEMVVTLQTIGLESAGDSVVNIHAPLKVPEVALLDANDSSRPKNQTLVTPSARYCT